MQGDQAQSDFEQAPLPYETPAMTQGRVAQGQQQRVQYGRMKAEDLASRGIPYDTSGRGNVSEITDATGAPLSNADKTNKIAYDSAGKPVDYSQRDPTTGKHVLTDPYANVPDWTEPTTGNVYRRPKGLPWVQTGTDPAVTQQIQAKVNAQTATALAPVEQQAKTALTQAAKAVKISGAQTKVALQTQGVILDPNAPDAAKKIDDAFNTEYGSPEANATPFWGGGTRTPEAEALRKQIDARKAAANAALAQHQQVVTSAQQAQAQLDQVRGTRGQLQGDKMAELNRRRVAVGLDPINIGGNQTGPSVADVQQQGATLDTPATSTPSPAAPESSPSPTVAAASPAAAPAPQASNAAPTTPEELASAMEKPLPPGSKDSLPVTGDGRQHPLGSLVDRPVGSGATEADYPLESLAPLTREKVAAARANDYKNPSFGETAMTPTVPIMGQMGPQQAGKIARSIDPTGILDSMDIHGVDRTAALLHNVTADTLNFFTSPVGVATLGIGALPKLAQKAIAAVFAGQAAHEIPNSVRDVILAKTPEERDEAIKRTVESAAVLGGTSAHILDRARAANASVGDPNAGPVQRTFNEPPEEPHGPAGLGPSPNEPTPPSQPSPNAPNLALPQPPVSEPVSPAANEPATGNELAPQSPVNGGEVESKNLTDSLAGKTLPLQSANGVDVNTPLGPDGDSSRSKTRSDRVLSDAEVLSNAGKSPALKTQGLSGLDVPTQRAVVSSVFGLAHDPKVLDSIIKLIPVDVVNNLAARKLTPEMAFHDKAVLAELLSGDLSNPIAMNGDSASRLVRYAAGRSAEVAARLAKVGGSSVESNSALKTNGIGLSHAESNTETGTNGQEINARQKELASMAPKDPMRPLVELQVKQLTEGQRDEQPHAAIADQSQVPSSTEPVVGSESGEAQKAGSEVQPTPQENDLVVPSESEAAASNISLEGQPPTGSEQTQAAEPKGTGELPKNAAQGTLSSPEATPETEPAQEPTPKAKKPVASPSKSAEVLPLAAKSLPDVATLKPHEVLNDAKNVKLTTPKGARFLRVTDSKGRQIVEPIENVTKGANVFHQAGPFKRVEAGVLNSAKKFVPVPGELTITDANKPAPEPPAKQEQAPVTPTKSPEAASVEKLANAALALHKDSLTALGHPHAFETGETRAGSGIETDVQSQRIRIDPEKLAKATAKMTPAVRAEFVKRAVAQEVIHVGTLKYAAESAANRQKLLGLNDDEELMKRAADAYGPEWKDQSDFAKAAEAARMLLEGPEKLTEASYKFLKEFLEWMKSKLKNLSKDAREVLDGIRQKLGQFEKSTQETKEQAPPETSEKPATPSDIRAEITKLKADGDPEGLVPGLERYLAKKEAIGAANPEDQGPFYSQLTRTVQALPQDTMTVGQAKAAITKGAKPDEIKASGILDDPLSPLAGRPDGARVTRYELQDYAVERATKVQDVTLGGEGVNKKENWKALVAALKKDDLGGYESVQEAARGVTMALDGSEHNDWSQETLEAARKYRDENGVAAHFDQYQLPGAEPGSYREQFVTWPQRTENDFSVVQQADDKYAVRSKHGAVIARNLATEAEAQKLADGGKTPTTDWNDGHAAYNDIANPVVRIRRNIRTDADGKRTYFVEEMQGPQKSEQENMPPEVRKRIYEIGMKRAIRDAVDSGADAIGWTSGETQAGRYDLSRHFKSITASGVSGAPDRVSIQGGAVDSDQSFDKTYSKAELPDVVGKELADRIVKDMEDENNADNGKTYSGLDLKVGGEGIKALYDKMLPNIANKLAEKVGGKVGASTVATRRGEVGGVEDDRDQFIKWYSQIGSPGELTESELKTKWADGSSDLISEFLSSQEGTRIHSLDIPKAWKDEAPQFALYAATPDAGATPEGGASEQPPSQSQPGHPEAEGTLAKGEDSVAARNEKLMEEAEAAGLSPSLETIKGILRADPKAMDKLRTMIKDRTGKDAINAATPELPDKPSEMPMGAANPTTPPGKRKVPGIDIFKNVKEGVQSLTLPSAIDAEHLEAAEVLGGKLGAMNQRAESARALSAPAWLQFEKDGVHKEQPLATNPGVKFMSNASTGRPQAPEYQHYADLRDREYSKRVDALEKADVPLQNVRDNYFPGVWTNESRRAFNLAMGAARESGIIPDGVTVNTATAAQKDWVKKHVDAYLAENRGSDDNSALGYLTRNPFKGKEGFRKQKVFDQDIITAMEFGLKPVSANPVDIDRLKWSEMDRNIMANEAMKEWKIYNQMRVVAPGAKIPDGWEKVDPDGKHGIGNVYAPPNPDVFGRTIVGQRIVPHAVADILNNYLSSTLYNNRYFGKLYTGWMGLANALNQSQLGVGSAFHAGFTTAEKEITAGAEVIKDIYGVLTGNRHFGHLMGSVGGVFKAGWDTAKLISYFGRKGATGNDVLNAWRFPDQTIDPKIAQVVRAAELAGGGFTMERGLQTDQTSKMVSDWYNGKALKAAARSPVAAIEMMAHPIMNYLVPRQKAGAFAMLANRIIDENPGVPLEELRPEFRQAWNRIDARMGQVRYDRLFANNVAKNVVQGVVRAPGWSGGTIAELGGAFKDTYSFFKEWAQNGKAPKNIPDRVAYTIALVAGTMIVNGILTKLMTGQNPEGLDYFAFRDGGKDEKGNPSRLILPTYMKDLLAYTKEPLGTLADKQHPILALIHDLVQNKDYYGVKIRNEDDGKLKQAYDSGKYFAKAFIPFWVRGEQKMAEQGKTPLQKALPMIGVMPAAQKVTNTPAQKLASEYARDSMPVGGRTQAQADKSNAERKIVQQIRAGKTSAIPDAIRAGAIKDSDASGLIKRASETPLQSSFQYLALDKAEAVFKVANPDEKKQLMPMMLTKRDNAAKKTVQFSTEPKRPAYQFR